MQRTPFEIFSRALQELEDEPGPMTPEKAELMHFLRRKIAEYATADRLMGRPPEQP